MTRLLTESEMKDGAAQQLSAWCVGQWRDNYTAEPRVACDEPEAPNPPVRTQIGRRG